jgi:hypothetical protein
MPKQAMDYSKCVIYKITCCDESVTECYVGHTTNFVKRKHSHKSNCNNSTIKLYQMIREHGGWENWTMTPICEYPCENLIQACIKEEEYKIELQARLNSHRAFLSEEEKQKRDKNYREKNKEKSKEWRELNKEQIKEKFIEYRESHKEKFIEYQKEYREAHKEQIVKYKKKYQQEHKEQIKEKKRLKYQQKKLVQSEN